MVNNNKSLYVTPAERAILTTIFYSDIFSFPLTKDELWRFLIVEKKITRQEFDYRLRFLKEYIVFQDGYYCLKGREAIIGRRKKNLSEVTKKFQRARMVSERLASIISVLFIGISGGLAVGNATDKDDIDLVVIVKKNTLFASRLFILGVLEKMGVRRSRNQKHTADTICVNLLFDETALFWFGAKQDIYTAREIAQIVPLFERNDMYRTFLVANKWIQQFLPNVAIATPLVSKTYDTMGSKLISAIFINPFSEYLSRVLQLSLIKRHQTKEVVKKNVLAFHPIDYRIKILKQLRLRVRQFGLLTKV